MGGINLAPEISVKQISECLVHLDVVKRLGKENQKTLGLFPEGAFDDYAKAGTIAVAIENATCVGYVLYRLSRGQATIVHLCVDPSARNKGVARHLITYLVAATAHLAGIALKCRRDYDANAMWPKFGFTVQGEVPGRGKAKKPLICWWRANRNTTLFADAAIRQRESTISAVIDSNILFDLMQPEGRDAVPSLSLRADWLAEVLQLFVTDEVFSEINKHDDAAQRKSSHRFASQFLCLPCDASNFDQIHSRLRPLFPPRVSSNTESDIRQVARAVAAESTFFLTRDDHLLRMRDQIEDQFGLTVLHPTDLISRFDEYRRQSDYQPVRFAGTSLTMRRVVASELDALAGRFQCTPRAEKKATLLKHMRTMISEPDRFRVCALIDSGGSTLAMVATAEPVSGDKEFDVPLLRVATGPLAATIARKIVRHVVLSAARHRLPLVHIGDENMGIIVDDAVFESGFTQGERYFQKFNVYGGHRSSEIAAMIECVKAYLGDHIDEEPGYQDWVACLKDEDGWQRPEDVANEEHILWPGKITNGTIRNYVVPIQPAWAEHLFDEGLAAQGLFGRQQQLALNTESVYYRANRGPKMVAPARILWYVSDAHNLDGVKSIRACSRLDEVRVGPPKELFRQFRRLGIFSWEEVYETAGRDISTPIVALRFSDTELLDKPVAFHDLKQTLNASGNFSPIVSPFSITNEVFFKLYALAVR